MATSVTINIPDEDEAVLVKLAALHNAAQPDAPLTVAQFFRERIRDWVRSQAAKLAERESFSTRAAAYKQATPEEQAQIDALLAPYR